MYSRLNIGLNAVKSMIWLLVTPQNGWWIGYW